MIEDRTIPGGTSSSKPAVCPTRTAEAITRLLSSCHAYRLLGVVAGEPGTGKSTAATAYASAHPNALYCRMVKSAERPSPGLRRIAAAVGGDAAANAGADGAYQAIVSALRERPDALVVLDEAQHMDNDLLECIRGFYDECGIGLVLIGNFGLTARWSGQGDRGRCHNFTQLRGRLGPQLALPRPLAEDVEALIGHHGIMGKASHKLLHRSASYPGGLHNVEYVLRIARGLAGEGVSPPYRILKDAALITGAVQ